MLDSLLVKIKEKFPNFSKSTLKNVLLLSFCILEKETVCLNKLKNVVGKFLGNEGVQSGSHYKRLNRIFIHQAFSRLWVELLQYVFYLLRLECSHLILDGTSWQSSYKGKSYYHHYLTLSVVYRGVSIAIYWEDLRQKGISNQKQRKKVIRKAQKYFNLKGKVLLADREYIGTDWFTFLKKNGIDFIIRLRHKNYMQAVNAAEGKSYEALVAKAKRSKKPGKVLGKTIQLEGMTLRFMVVKNLNPQAKDELIYLLSSLDAPLKCIARQYCIRWQIEMVFKHLKSNGFDLEKMNVEGKARQRLLTAIVIFAYTLSICEGLKNYKKVPLKKYKNGKVYKQVSVFRWGIDQLMNQCQSFIQFCEYLIEHLHLNKNTYRNPNAIFV